MSLKCDEIRDRFSALWENELTPSEEMEVRGHLKNCPECGREFARFDKTLRMIHSTEEIEVPEGFLSGIYEKLEKRKRKPYPERNILQGRFRLPLQWRVPVKALAMVVVVFMAFYLTKMSPHQSIRMKEPGKKEASLSDRKDSPVEVQRAWPEEKNLGEVSTPKPLKTLKKGAIPEHPKERAGVGPESQIPAITSKTEAVPGGATSHPAARAQLGEKKMDQVSAYKSLENKPEGRGAVEQFKAGSLTKPDEVATGSPAPSLGETVRKKKDESSSLREAIPDSHPRHDFVLRTSDQGKAVSNLKGLARKFKGEILSMEGNVIIVSFQSSFFPEFKKELEAIGAQMKTPPMAPAGRGGNHRLTGVEARSEETEERDQEPSGSTSGRPPRTIIRIILLDH